MKLIAYFFLSLLLVGCAGSIPGGRAYEIIEHNSRSAPTPVAVRPPPQKAASPAALQVSPYPVLSQLFKATLTFLIPAVGNIDSVLNAQLAVNPSTAPSGTEKTIQATHKTVAQVEVSRKLYAHITAEDFHVTAVTPETQIIAADKPTEWLWELRPKRPGRFQVKLTVNAIVKVDGESSEHYLKKFEEVITVEVHPLQVVVGWLSEYWQWLISTLVLPFLLWVYKKKFSPA